MRLFTSQLAKPILPCLGLSLFFLTSALAQAEPPEPLVRDWAQIIQRNMPEKRMLIGIEQQQKSANKARHDWLGMASLNLGQEKNRAANDLPVENTEASVEMPLKVIRQNAVFRQLAQAYGKQAQAFEGWLGWQARGIARQLLNRIEEAQVRAQAAWRRWQQANKLYTLVQANVQAGEGSRLDEALARQKLSEAAAKRLDAQQSLLAQWQQAESWGIAVPAGDKNRGFPVLNTGRDSIESSDSLPSPENWLPKHPQFLWLQAQQETTVSAARKDWWEAGNSPSLAVGALREKSFESPEYTLTTVSVSVPLGRSPSARLARSSWKTALTNKDITLERTQLDLQRQWLKAKSQWQKARALIGPAEEQWQSAQEALSLTTQAWKAGERRLLDVLLAQQAALDARLAADLAHQRLAAARRLLKHAAGE